MTRSRDDQELIRYYQRLVSPFLHGQKAIVAVGSLSESRSWLEVLRQMQAASVLVLADSLGTTSWPEAGDFEWEVICDAARDMMDGMRNYCTALRHPTPSTQKKIEIFDPRKRAIVITDPFYDLADILGRMVFAPRPPEWRALEDKTRVDALLDEIGIAGPPGAVIDATDSTGLRELAEKLDVGQGVVVSGDSSVGGNGGASYVRWFRKGDDHSRIFNLFRRDCRRIRVAAFVEGLPCSIHGFVFPSHVAVFRPVELVVLRSKVSPRFLYAGSSTLWKPCQGTRRKMRGIARAIGEHLRERVAYRGAYCVDGILTRQGFLPTEINTRYSAGIHTLSASLPGLPLALLEMVLRKGCTLSYEPEWLEDAIVESVDREGRGFGWALTNTPIAEPAKIGVNFQGGEAELTDGKQESDATVLLGPAQMGGVVRVRFDPKRMGAGCLVSPYVARVFLELDRAVGTSFGEMAAPPAAAEHGSQHRPAQQ